MAMRKPLGGVTYLTEREGRVWLYGLRWFAPLIVTQIQLYCFQTSLLSVFDASSWSWCSKQFNFESQHPGGEADLSGTGGCTGCTGSEAAMSGGVGWCSWQMVVAAGCWFVSKDELVVSQAVGLWQDCSAGSGLAGSWGWDRLPAKLLSST